MKNKLLLLAVVLLATLSTRAVNTIEEGVNYYIMNVETDLFLGGQNNWGTRGCLSTDAGIFQFVQGTTGEGYNLVNTLVSVTNKNLGTNLYVDNAGTVTTKADESAGTTMVVDGIWSVEDLGGGIFAFRCASDWAYDAETETWTETKHGYLARSEEKGTRKGYNLEFSETITDACQFYVMTREEALAYMVNKAQSSNVSFNFLIKNPDYCRNQSTADWTVSPDCWNKNLAGGANDNMCAESWHSTFTISQVIEGLPAGRYQLSAQGFWRRDGQTHPELPVVFAGETEVALPERTGTENSMTEASNSFTAGKYQIEPVRFELTEEVNDLEIGFRMVNNNEMWVIWDNIQLMSYSNVVEYAQEILAGIKYPIEGVGSADAKAAYDQAYSDFKTWVEGLQQGEATFDEVDQRYADYVLAENAWKASIASWSNYVTVSEKARKLYTQIASQEGKYKPAVSMNALNAYVNGAASAYGPGSSSGSYVFVNGCYNYIMQARSMSDEAIVNEVAFVNGLMNDVKKDVVQPGMDVSFLLVNPDFTEAGGAGWNGVGGITDPHGGLSGWPCAEAYDKASFDFYQIVEGAPAGLYSISVNAFYRPTWNGAWTGEEKVPVEIYMGTVSSPIQHIAKDPVENDLVYDDNTQIWQGTIAKNGTNVLYWQADPSDLWKYNENEDPTIQNIMANSTHIGGSHMTDYSWDDGSGTGKLVPNGMTGASVAFSAGRYPMTVYGEVPDEGQGVGTLRIGIRATSAMHWALWSNFRLVLLGEDREAMRAQLIEKLNTLKADPLLIEGSGLQEVFLNDTVLKKVPEYETLIDNTQATYQDFKDAYDDVVYMIDKLGVYQEVINKFFTDQAELAELINGYEGEESLAQMAQNFYDVFDYMSTLESGSMINLTNEDMENLKIYDEAQYGAAPDIIDREMLMDAEFDPTLALDGAYTSTYDFYNSLLAELRVQLGSIFIQVAGTGTAENPEDLTEQLRNPAFESDEQWWGDTWGDIQYTAGEMYQKVFDTYQSVHLPKGFYTLVGYAMDRRGDWASVLSNNAQWRYNDASFLYAKVGEGDTMTVEAANGLWIAQTEDLTEGTGGIATYEVGDPAVTYYAPNSMAQYRNWMDAKGDFNFGTELSFEVTDENGVFASLGFFRRAYEGSSWFIADRIELYYAVDGNPVTGVNTLEASAEKFGQAEGKRLEGNRIVIYSNGKKFNTAGQILK